MAVERTSVNAEGSAEPIESGSLKPQFNTRALLYLTIGVAITAAIIGPFFREWTQQQRVWYLMAVSAELVLIAGALAFGRRQRCKYLAQAGRCYYRTSYRDTAKARTFAEARVEWRSVFPILLHLAYNLWWCAYVIQNEQSHWQLLMGYVHVAGVYISACQFLAISQGISPRDVELCENGFISGALGYQPWSTIRDVRPTHTFDDRIIFVVNSGSLALSQVLNVPEPHRDELIRRMQERLVSSPTAQCSVPKKS